jgi:N-acetylgalactosamine PTS system EIIA component
MSEEGDASSANRRAVVAAHGDLAAGFVSAVARITGRGDALVPLTNQGLGGEQLEQLLRETLAASNAHLVFTDLPGGSWTIAARRVQRTDASVVVVAGVSLPVLLAWVTAAEGDAAAAAADAVEKGRRALLVAGGAAVPGATRGD